MVITVEETELKWPLNSEETLLIWKEYKFTLLDLLNQVKKMLKLNGSLLKLLEVLELLS
jgi:signal recognition particle GTPase